MDTNYKYFLLKCYVEGEFLSYKEELYLMKNELIPDTKVTSKEQNLTSKGQKFISEFENNMVNRNFLNNQF